MSMGLANLVVSSPLLNSVLVPDRGYFTFNVLESLLIPHLQGLGILWVLIHSVIFIIRYYKIQSKWWNIGLCAVLLLFVFRGFLSAAGIAPLAVAAWLYGWLVYSGLDWLDSTALKRVGSFAFVGLVVLVLFRKERSFAPLFRACAAFGWALAVLAIFRIAPALVADAQMEKARHKFARSAQTTSSINRSVVWVIFDEFDYSRFFENRNPDLQLLNLDRLQQEGISATNAVSPASATEVSIPALVLGAFLTGTVPVDAGKLLLKMQGAEDIEWGKASTIFSRLWDLGKDIAILGFSLPYCSEFPYANPCVTSPGLAYPRWWWGIWVALKTVPGVELLVPEGRSFYAEGWNQATRLQLKQLENHISNDTITLSFVHLNIPHLPGGRVYKIPLPQSPETLTGYEKNALAVDWVVGRIVERLEVRSRSQDVLLIVSSDHWLRADQQTMGPDEFVKELGNDHTVVHKIPLLIRRMRETSRYVITKPVSTIHTAQLIDDFLAGRVIDHAGMAEWWLDKPYAEPVVFKRLQKY